MQGSLLQLLCTSSTPSSKRRDGRLEASERESKGGKGATAEAVRRDEEARGSPVPFKDAAAPGLAAGTICSRTTSTSQENGPDGCQNMV